MKKIILACWLALFAGSVYAQSRMTPEKIKVIDSLLTYLYKEKKFMGSVCIREQGKPLFSKAYGIIGKKNGKPVPANTASKYRIGSISKTYTAVMIMQLAEAKKLSLDDTLSKYFNMIPNAKKISIRQLLTHQSGLYNFTNDLQWSSQYTPVSKKEMLAAFAKDKPDFEPGSKTAYSNTNYMLLGYIIEQVTGKSFNDNLQELICKKLGLKNTSLPKGGTDIIKNEAFSFMLQDDQTWEQIDEIHVSASDGAGGIIAPVEEVNRFFEALIQHKLLTSGSVQQMLPVQGENAINPINSYGYGLETLPFGEDHIGYGHSGHIDGFYTMCGYFPEEQLSISFFDNGKVMSFNQINIYLLSIIFDKAYTFPDFKKITVTESALTGLSGIYRAEGVPMDVTVAAYGNKLWARASGQDSFLLTAIGTDKFEFQQADIMMRFVRDKQGLVQSLTMEQGGDELVMNRVIASNDVAIKVVDAALLSKYEGVYSAPDFPMKLTIRKTGTGISGQGTGQPEFPLTAVSESTFKFDPIGLELTFKNSADGVVTGMIVTQGKTFELKKEQ
ncbi:MAG: serine hydrolase [Sphingobacteriales bacterium]|nr:MAG: serine hydrolase [Sphingobacteriales bacterium]